MFSSVARIALPLLAAAGLLALSSCGDDDDSGAALSTVQIKPSSYSVKEPATTTTVPTSAAAGADGRSAAEQSYIVQSDQDVPFNIARKFDISLDELRNYNGWDASYSGFPGKGGTVRIPPGAKFIDPNATTTTAAGATATSDSSGSTPADGSSGGDRCHPTYEVQSGDAPLVITRKFDVTIEQLNAANASTPNWPNLYTGRSINLPPPADCAGAATTTTLAAG
jgi:LysM repeat protein